MSTTVQDGLTFLTELLRQHGIEGAPREARLLLAHCLSAPPERLTLLLRDPLDDRVLARARALAGRRAAREPMSHILGHRAFFGRRFAVDGRVLDPRPETELLVELALAGPFSTVLDLGVGTGCILLTLLAERPDARGTGVDISDGALAVAQSNSRALSVADRCTLVASDWFSDLSGTFDLIVSNPPYIGTDEIAGLAPEVRQHEPRLALDGGRDGLAAYRAIAAGAGRFLVPGGRLLVEIGPEQADAVRKLLTAGGLADIAVHRDLDGRDRVVAARMPG